MINSKGVRFFFSLATGALLISAFGEPEVRSHGGRLNVSGCHNDKKLNTYHCHQSTSSPQQQRDSDLRIESDSPAIKSGTVVIMSCYDGDTCTTTQGEKIRLACIDTPELRGSRADPIPAQKARDFLNDLVAGKRVSIRRISKDRYSRTVAELSIDGVNIQELMVKKGLAGIYERYADPCPWAI